MSYSKEKDYYVIDDSKNLISVHFPSVCDLLDYDHKFKATSDDWTRWPAYRSKNREWIGPTSTTGKEIIDKALIGDAEMYEKHLVDKINQLAKATGKLTADYTQQIQVSRRKPVRNGYGDELDIHRVYQGQLDKAWRRTQRVEVAQETKLVTLFIQIAGISSENAVDSLWRAAAAIHLMEELQKAGKSVKIVVGGYSAFVTRKRHEMTVSITVKEYNERLSVQRLAAMTHLGFYRTFGFMAKAAQPYALRSSYGYTEEMTQDKMPIQFREDIHKGHAKFVVLGRSMNLTEAVRSVNNAHRQMKEFSENG